MERPYWAPVEVDIERPSIARVYDYYLGGSHNFAVDRAMGQQAIKAMPELTLIMQANRAFLRRAVRELVGRGVRQFIDIGSGIPTVGNVHEVAAALDPTARVVYVDVDPVAVAHSRAILDGDPRARVIRADARDTRQLLDDPVLRGTLDLDAPVAVLMIAVLHFLSDTDDPRGVIRTLADAVAPGSYLAVSHASHDGAPARTGQVAELYARSPMPMTFRSRAEITELFTGFELVDPGLVPLPLWRPESPDDLTDGAERFPGFAGVGRKG